MNKKLIRLTESDLHRIVRMSVNKVLRESEYGKPTSWKEHNDGIATYDEYGNEIGGYNFGAPFHGDSPESLARRKERHAASDFGHPNSDRLIHNRTHSAHDFSHSDDDAVFFRHNVLGDDEIWKDNEIGRGNKIDKNLQRALDAADKRPLHRKGSLNRA